MQRVLLLNNNYLPLSFISERHAIKLYYKNKVEVIDNWNILITHTSGSFQLPSILRLKELILRTYYNYSFCRQDVIKRDQYRCQYCNKKLPPSQITIDHILPKSRGGNNSYLNCVVCCFPCNSAKGNNTPEEAGMKLIRKPYHPIFNTPNVYIDDQEIWHENWNTFLGIVI